MKQIIDHFKKYKRIIPKSLWEYFRLQSILASHEKVASFWDEVLKKYAEGSIVSQKPLPKKNILNSEKIIWQYWGQGLSAEKLPEVVQKCFESVDKYKGDYQIIRLCDDNLVDYLELPTSILSKYKNGIIGKAHFSDLLRLALLTSYGGVWLDATVFLTAPLTDYCSSQDWFMFQRDDAQEDKKAWSRTYAYYFGWHEKFKVRLLNSVIFAKKDSQVINDLYSLLLYFWNTEDKEPDYFFFQILFTQYMELYPERNCQIISDCIPNLLQMKLTGSYTKFRMEEILQKASIHKLSYKSVSIAQFEYLSNERR